MPMLWARTHLENEMLSVLEKSIRIGCLAMKMRPFSRKYSSPWTALTLALIPCWFCALRVSAHLPLLSSGAHVR